VIGVAIVFLVVFASFAAAFRPDLAGSDRFWWVFGLPHLALAIFASERLYRDGRLRERLTPRGGDISIGALTALALLAASWAVRASLTPTGSPRQAWLFWLYAQIGDPDRVQQSIILTGTLCGIAVAEEIIWRGYVLDRLTTRFGERRGWLLAAMLYALAALPTAYTLRDSVAGPNPLLVLAALGCGIVWTFLAARFKRLLPVIVSHVAFTYFSAVQFRWPV
jgi:membrane protease YdiL (CAAX protease family)